MSFFMGISRERDLVGSQINTGRGRALRGQVWKCLLGWRGKASGGKQP